MAASDGEEFIAGRDGVFYRMEPAITVDDPYREDVRDVAEAAVDIIHPRLNMTRFHTHQPPGDILLETGSSYTKIYDRTVQGFFDYDGMVQENIGEARHILEQAGASTQHTLTGDPVETDRERRARRTEELYRRMYCGERTGPGGRFTGKYYVGSISFHRDSLDPRRLDAEQGSTIPSFWATTTLE